MRILRVIPIVLAALAAVFATSGAAQRSAAQTPAGTAASPADATSRIVAAAQAVLTSLDETGRSKVQFPFEGPQKVRWSNFRPASSSARGCAWAISRQRSAPL